MTLFGRRIWLEKTGPEKSAARRPMTVAGATESRASEATVSRVRPKIVVRRHAERAVDGKERKLRDLSGDMNRSADEDQRIPCRVSIRWKHRPERPERQTDDHACDGHRRRDDRGRSMEGIMVIPLDRERTSGDAMMDRMPSSPMAVNVSCSPMVVNGSKPGGSGLSSGGRQNGHACGDERQFW